jgi:hypothetical protein
MLLKIIEPLRRGINKWVMSGVMSGRRLADPAGISGWAGSLPEVPNNPRELGFIFYLMSNIMKKWYLILSCCGIDRNG